MPKLINWGGALRVVTVKLEKEYHKVNAAWEFQKAKRDLVLLPLGRCNCAVQKWMRNAAFPLHHPILCDCSLGKLFCSQAALHCCFGLQFNNALLINTFGWNLTKFSRREAVKRFITISSAFPACLVLYDNLYCTYYSQKEKPFFLPLTGDWKTQSGRMNILANIYLRESSKR